MAGSVPATATESSSGERSFLPCCFLPWESPLLTPLARVHRTSYAVPLVAGRSGYFPDVNASLPTDVNGTAPLDRVGSALALCLIAVVVIAGYAFFKGLPHNPRGNPCVLIPVDLLVVC